MLNMEVKDVTIRGSAFHAKFEINDLNSGYSCVTKTSPEYTIYGSIGFQLQVTIIKLGNGYSAEHNNLIFVKFTHKSLNQNDFIFKVSSKKFNIVEKNYKSDDTCWRLIHDVKMSYNYAFDIEVIVATVDTPGPFLALYDDADLLDFELRAEDGSIFFHKAVLAASSPVIRNLLEGEWLDSGEGRIAVTGTTKATLQALKDFIYMRSVSDSDLLQLLLLSVHYKMPDMEQKCVDRLMSTITAHNALGLSEFAVKHKMTRLHLAILECFQSGSVNIEELRDVCMKKKLAPDDKKDKAPESLTAAQRRRRPRSRSNSLVSRRGSNRFIRSNIR